MSTFPGRMQEYPELSLDRFDGPNLESAAYFLSHKHLDHMQGLASDSFRYRLESNSHIHLYVSDVTRRLLIVDPRYSWLEKHMVTLALDNPTVIEVPDPKTGQKGYSVTVTFLHAGHCPGSVMFLFEGGDGTVLYTGDFRLNRSDVEGITHLHSGTRPKLINSMYLDTTFCKPQALHFPGRDDIMKALTDFIQEWLNEGPHHMAVIGFKASLGYEHLFKSISEELNTKLHASESTHRQCQQIPELREVTTLDPSSTRVHICKWQPGTDSPLPCRYVPPEGAKVEVRRITVSTMYFVGRVSEKGQFVVKEKKKANAYRACYSFHSSYSEIRDIIMYLRPKRVKGNVIPRDGSGHEIQDRLDRFCLAANKAAKGSVKIDDSQPRELGILRKRKRVGICKHQSFGKSSDSENLDFGDQESPEMKRKRSSVTGTIHPAVPTETGGSSELHFHLSDVDSSQEVQTPSKLSQSIQHMSGEESDLSGYNSHDELQHESDSDPDWEANDEEIQEVRRNWEETLSQSVHHGNDSPLSDLRVYISDGEQEALEFGDMEEGCEPDSNHLDQDHPNTDQSPPVILEIKPLPEVAVPVISEEETKDSVSKTKTPLLEFKLAKFSEESPELSTYERKTSDSKVERNRFAKGDEQDIIILDDESEGESDDGVPQSQDTDKTVDYSACTGGATAPIDLTLEDSRDGYCGDTESDAESDITVDENKEKGSLVLVVSQNEVKGKYMGKDDSTFVVRRPRQSSDDVIILDDPEEPDGTKTPSGNERNGASHVINLQKMSPLGKDGNAHMSKECKVTDEDKSRSSHLQDKVCPPNHEENSVPMHEDSRGTIEINSEPGIELLSVEADSSECEVPPTPDTSNTRRLSTETQRREMAVKEVRRVKKVISFDC